MSDKVETVKEMDTKQLMQGVDKLMEALRAVGGGMLDEYRVVCLLNSVVCDKLVPHTEGFAEDGSNYKEILFGLVADFNATTVGMTESVYEQSGEQMKTNAVENRKRIKAYNEAQRQMAAQELEGNTENGSTSD